MSAVWRDTGWQALQNRLQEMRLLKVRVGYQQGEGRQRHPDSEISVALLAAIHEFGSEDQGIPERSFIRSTITERQSQITAVYRDQAQAVVEGKAQPVEALAVVGQHVVGLIRDKLNSATSWAAPLDPETIDQKGSARVLEDTGALSDNLSWRVSKGSATLAKGSR